jgi:2-polyprenyl-6-methoxyphenol hydroxylase-like FAD-dependent oxidoreductase
MKNLFLSLFISVTIELFSQSIVIVGGGPAGLATAIEAHLAGDRALIIEKREAYIRSQALFLNDVSLELLNKWQVNLPQMQQFEISKSQRIGVIQIKSLEEGLEARCKELKIDKLHGECTNLNLDEKKITVRSDSGELELSYDLLVGADGAHSIVRDKLGICRNIMGRAIGAFAFIRHDTLSGEFDISDAMIHNDLFARRIAWGPASIIFVQSSSEAYRKALKDNVRQVLIKTSLAFGWNNEAEMLRNEGAKCSTDIEICLSQASSFSDTKRDIILVGDAAATASFFQGKGANTAFVTAKIAGDLFKNPNNYKAFNQAMKETTDQMIEDSRFLLEPDPNFSDLQTSEKSNRA